MNLNKKKILLIVFAIIIVAVGIVTAVVPQKEKEMDPEEFLERFEQAAEEVLGEDIQQISKSNYNYLYNNSCHLHYLYNLIQNALFFL